ncbi:hypothetical protein [Kaistia terrae]|uniref:Uncharacterized protein n=1 Tax=Kaistia terrae TaxID=537017 RepID=A0ABW0Q3P8_9HYPH|nr:hypothetical protein [Kaistia terrae]MCX5581219.1 hypothetical protein [Kaistia terrae]
MSVRIESMLAASSCARFFGDGKPTWKQGKKQKAPLSSKEASSLRLQLIKVLRRHGKRRPDALALANRLADCHANSRCLSGACPECRRALQRMFVEAASRYQANDRWLFFTASCVPSRGIPGGSLK